MNINRRQRSLNLKNKQLSQFITFNNTSFNPNNLLLYTLHIKSFMDLQTLVHSESGDKIHLICPTFILPSFTAALRNLTKLQSANNRMTRLIIVSVEGSDCCLQKSNPMRLDVDCTKSQRTASFFGLQRNCLSQGRRRSKIQPGHLS